MGGRSVTEAPKCIGCGTIIQTEKVGEHRVCTHIFIRKRR